MFDGKALAQSDHVSPGLIAREVVLSQTVDLSLDQISCHCPTCPPLGNHGADASALAWKKNGLFCCQPVARYSLMTPVKDEVLRLGQNRAA